MWLEGLTQGGLLVREALRTGLWGLQCPIHCRELSLASLALAFVLGLFFGLFLASVLWIWLLVHPSPSSPLVAPAGRVLRSAATQARRRLEGYRPSLHEREAADLSDVVKALDRLTLAVQDQGTRQALSACF